MQKKLCSITLAHFTRWNISSFPCFTQTWFFSCFTRQASVTTWNLSTTPFFFYDVAALQCDFILSISTCPYDSPTMKQWPQAAAEFCLCPRHGVGDTLERGHWENPASICTYYSNVSKSAPSCLQLAQVPNWRRAESVKTLNEHNIGVTRLMQ